jgi:hypothetical protein
MQFKYGALGTVDDSDDEDGFCDLMGPLPTGFSGVGGTGGDVQTRNERGGSGRSGVREGGGVKLRSSVVDSVSSVDTVNPAERAYEWGPEVGAAAQVEPSCDP